MKEAVVSVYVPETESEPAHTEVWRVEFEGEFSDLMTCVENFPWDTPRVVSVERLVGGGTV
jgi:hypothetical protein